MHVEGGERRRPDDPLCIVVLLDRGRGGPTHADPIAAHHHHLLPALLVEVERLHLLAILGAQHEDVADLDAADDARGFGAPRTGVAGDGIAQIGVTVRREIAAGRDVHPVGARRISPNDDIGQTLHRQIGNERHALESDGPGESHRRAAKLLHRGRIGHRQVRRAKDFLHLDLVNDVVAADQNGHRLPIGEI